MATPDLSTDSIIDSTVQLETKLTNVYGTIFFQLKSGPVKTGPTATGEFFLEPLWT